MYPFRYFLMYFKSQNREMSQKPIIRKLGLNRRNQRLPVVIQFASVETRQRDWGNLVTIHSHHSNAYVWKFRHRVVTEIILRQPSWSSNAMMTVEDKRTHSTAVAVSPCGNFAAIGSKGGLLFYLSLIHISEPTRPY